MAQCNFNILELGVFEFPAHLFKGVFEFVSQAPGVGPAISRCSIRHFAIGIYIQQRVRIEMVGVLKHKNRLGGGGRRGCKERRVYVEEGSLWWLELDRHPDQGIMPSLV